LTTEKREVAQNVVDVHAHQFPQKYIETVTRHGRQLLAPLMGGAIEERLSLMDTAGVDMQVLSPANLLPYFDNEAIALEAARILNDGYAELTHRLPKRFKAYVSLPMPHVDASLRESADWTSSDAPECISAARSWTGR
jgi:6-methylsalicylate decarboxylase